MSSLSPTNRRLAQSLYRSLLKQCQIIDQSPIHRCFLFAKPNKLWLRDHGQAMPIKLSSPETDFVERLLNDSWNGEYYSPTYLPTQSTKQPMSTVLHDLFRYGIPAEQKSNFNNLLGTDTSVEQEFLRNIQMCFYAKKKLSSATDLISKLSQTDQQAFLNAFSIPQQRAIENESDFAHFQQQSITNTKTKAPSKTTDPSPSPSPSLSPTTNTTSTPTATKRFSRLPLTQSISFSSLKPIDIRAQSSKSSDSDGGHDKLLLINKGAFLISHPMACVTQDDLYRSVIYVIESNAERVVGIVLNIPNYLFQNNGSGSTSTTTTATVVGNYRSSEADAHRKIGAKTKRGGGGKKQQFQSDFKAAPSSSSTSTSAAAAAAAAKSSFEDCFYGWKGEYNYSGGPVADQDFIFYIMHNNHTLYKECKDYSSVLIDGNGNGNGDGETKSKTTRKTRKNKSKEKNERGVIARHENNMYWTWVGSENHEQIYHTLGRISKVLTTKQQQLFDEINAVKLPAAAAEAEATNSNEAGKVDSDVIENTDANASTTADSESSESMVDNAQVIADGDAEAQDEDDEGEDTEAEEVEDDYYDSIMSTENESVFKFFSQYAIWSPEQLRIELENNVWWPVHFASIDEESKLLQLKCPTTKLVNEARIKHPHEAPPHTNEGKNESTSHTSAPWKQYSNREYVKKFNKWMWQAMLRALGTNCNSEFYHLSVFPDLSPEIIRGHFEYLAEFHQSWVPDLSQTDLKEEDLEDEESDDSEDEENETLF